MASSFAVSSVPSIPSRYIATVKKTDSVEAFSSSSHRFAASTLSAAPGPGHHDTLPNNAYVSGAALSFNSGQRPSGLASVSAHGTGGFASQTSRFSGYPAAAAAPGPGAYAVQGDLSGRADHRRVRYTSNFAPQTAYSLRPSSVSPGPGTYNAKPASSMNQTRSFRVQSSTVRRRGKFWSQKELLKALRVKSARTGGASGTVRGRDAVGRKSLAQTLHVTSDPRILHTHGFLQHDPLAVPTKVYRDRVLFPRSAAQSFESPEEKLPPGMHDMLDAVKNTRPAGQSAGKPGAIPPSELLKRAYGSQTETKKAAVPRSALRGAGGRAGFLSSSHRFGPGSVYSVGDVGANDHMVGAPVGARPKPQLQQEAERANEPAPDAFPGPDAYRISRQLDQSIASRSLRRQAVGQTSAAFGRGKSRGGVVVGGKVPARVVDEVTVNAAGKVRRVQVSDRLIGEMLHAPDDPTLLRRLARKAGVHNKGLGSSAMLRENHDLTDSLRVTGAGGAQALQVVDATPGPGAYHVDPRVVWDQAGSGGASCLGGAEVSAIKSPPRNPYVAPWLRPATATRAFMQGQPRSQIINQSAYQGEGERSALVRSAPRKPPTPFKGFVAERKAMALVARAYQDDMEQTPSKSALKSRFYRRRAPTAASQHATGENVLSPQIKQTLNKLSRPAFGSSTNRSGAPLNPLVEMRKRMIGKGKIEVFRTAPGAYEGPVTGRFVRRTHHYNPGGRWVP